MMVAAQKQKGVALVAAIFLLVVLAALGVYLVQMAGTQRATSLFALQGARAYHAAKSAVEFGVHQALNNSAIACGTAPASPVNQTISFSEGGLQGFSASLSCEYTRHDENGDCFNVYVINVQASRAAYGTADYVSRRLQTTVTNHVEGMGDCP